MSLSKRQTAVLVAIARKPGVRVAQLGVKRATYQDLEELRVRGLVTWDVVAHVATLTPAGAAHARLAGAAVAP